MTYTYTHFQPDEDLKLHVRCAETAFKISINDQEVASWSDLHTGGSPPTLGFFSYGIGNTYFKQYDCGRFGCTNMFCGADITACSWQFGILL